MDQLGRLPLRVLSIDNMLSKKKVCTLGGPKPHSRSISLAWYSCLSRQLPVSNCTHRLVLCLSQPPVSCATQGAKAHGSVLSHCRSGCSCPAGKCTHLFVGSHLLLAADAALKALALPASIAVSLAVVHTVSLSVGVCLPGSFRAVSGVSSDRPLRNTMRAGTRRPCRILRRCCGILGP